MWGVSSPADRSVGARPNPLSALSRLPLVVAPMAGGPSTVELVVAAGEAGALGILAGGYKTADALAAEMASVRHARCPSFGVNLFVPGSPTTEPEALAAYLAGLAHEAGELGATLGEATWDDDAYEDKMEAVLAAPPPMVSFTFGLPARDVVRELQAAGSLVVLTVTTQDEAAQALAVGPDCLCVQGAEAGAHRGSFANDDRAGRDRPILELLAAVARSTDVPLIAAGGVGGPEDVAALIDAGAAMVQAGTAFLRCHESGAPAVYKAALADLGLRRDGGDPSLQRPSCPRAGQRHGARPPRRACGVPRGQQRHTPAARGGGTGRRHDAHESLRRHGLPAQP